MPAFIDLTGKRVGRLRVLRRYKNNDYSGGSKWVCKCDCGNKTVVNGANLRIATSFAAHITKSCGCLAIEINTRHGHAKGNTKAEKSPTYKTWNAMHSRCYYEKHPAYARYGGRGIVVCKRWHKFENFLNDMGERPKNKTLDRINGNKNYTPSNCRWLSALKQQRNKSSNVLLKYKGSVKCVSEWAEVFNLKVSTLRERLKRGWSIEKALTTSTRLKIRKEF